MSQLVATQLERERSGEPSHLANDPIALFRNWLQEAIDSGIKDPTAMTVATVDSDGYPDARLLLH
jgi:pyridoxamine 5'-phosphate oxidase